MRRWRSCLLTLFFRLKRKLFGKQYAAQSALERTNGALAWGSRKFGADYETWRLGQCSLAVRVSSFAPGDVFRSLILVFAFGYAASSLFLASLYT
mmetsp:Transcript_7271/g.17594  ORF Transcript_7271/g.17594 Transcript_7271/m.17594 type:complete len:95 (-) Transcript_7271:91-375(-)